jgi:hypothetical protein
MAEFFAKVEITYVIEADTIQDAGKIAESNFMALGEFDTERGINWDDSQSSVAIYKPSQAVSSLLIKDLDWYFTSQFVK